MPKFVLNLNIMHLIRKSINITQTLYYNKNYKKVYPSDWFRFFNLPNSMAAIIIPSVERVYNFPIVYKHLSSSR